MSLDETHDPGLRSWVESAHEPGCEFPIQNLPFGIFKRKGQKEPARGGVAIGDQILDLVALGVRTGPDAERSRGDGPQSGTQAPPRAFASPLHQIAPP